MPCSEPGCGVVSPRFNFPGERIGIYCCKHKKTGMINTSAKRWKLSDDGETDNASGWGDEPTGPGGPDDPIDKNVKKCAHPLCELKARYGYFYDLIPVMCSKHKLVGMISTRFKCCQHENCLNKASFGYLTDRIARYCKNHKLPNTVSMSRLFCKHGHCNKIPIFGHAGGKARLYCSTHKLEGMVNLSHKPCSYNGCSEIGHYGYKDDRQKLYCYCHRTIDMVDLWNKLCEYADCSKVANYGYRNKNRVKYCETHKLDGMDYMKWGLCVHENCRTRSSFGPRGGKALYCSKHRSVGMINVVKYGMPKYSRNRKYMKRKKILCTYKGCDWLALYGSKGDGVRKYCQKHKQIYSIYLPAMFCKHEGCGKAAIFGYAVDKKKLYCMDHKINEMIDLLVDLCEHPGCKNSVNKKSSKYCPLHKDSTSSNRQGMCEHKGCHLSASFGYRGGQKLYCGNHKLDGMVRLRVIICTNTMVKRNNFCTYAGCKALAFYADKVDRIPKFCQEHKEPNSVSLKIKACEYGDCVSRAFYGGEDGVARYCARHKQDEMERIYFTRCRKTGCVMRVRYGYTADMIPRYCLLHKGPYMVEIVRKYSNNSHPVTATQKN